MELEFMLFALPLKIGIRKTPEHLQMELIFSVIPTLFKNFSKQNCKIFIHIYQKIKYLNSGLLI